MFIVICSEIENTFKYLRYIKEELEGILNDIENTFMYA